MDTVKPEDELIRDYYLEIICSNISKSPSDVLNYHGRKRELLEPRQVLQYALKENTTMSYKAIADLTKMKTHVVVMSNRKTVINLLETDRNFQYKYKEPLEMIRAKTTKRCLIIGNIYSLDQEGVEKVRAVLDKLIQKGKFPVLTYQEKGQVIPGFIRKRYKDLLECGSVCVLNGFDQVLDAKIEYQMAERLGMEIIYENLSL